MLLVDVHCHLDWKDFEGKLDKIIENARQAGVKKIITSGVNPNSAKKALEIAEEYDVVNVSLGLHPTDVLKLTDKEINDYIKFIGKNKEKIVAIGEVGLDKHWIKDEKELDRTKAVFKKMIALAEELNLPILIHSWDAEAEVIEMLENTKLKVILHCFSGNRELIDKVKDKFYFTIPTSIVKSKRFKKMVKWVDISRLLTETDAPFLSPIENQKNEPKNVKVVIDKIAEIKKMDKEEVANNIFKNYMDLF